MPLRHYHRKLDAGFVALPQMTGRRFGMPFILSPPTLTLRFRQNNGPTPSGDYQPSRSLSMAGSDGVEVWFDRDSLLPGEHWKDKIRQAIKNGDYFIACFSPEYIGRTTTYMNEELNVAIEELRLKQDSSEWFIPISIDSCKIPEIQIRSGLYLSDIQFMDLSKDADKGLHSIVKTIGVDGFHEIKQQLESLSKGC